MQVIKKRFVYLIVLAIALIGLLFLGTDKLWIETYYTNFIYPPVAHVLRIFFGWIPFSFGDVLYSVLVLWISYKIIRNFIKLFRRKITVKVVIRKAVKFFYIIVAFYVVLLLLWGLNYSRKGIGYQLNLPKVKYDSSQLMVLQNILVEKVNQSKSEIKNDTYPSGKQMFKDAVNSYENASIQYPFLKYKTPSIKPSLYGTLFDYLGFTGYYNPFTGEAQVNTTVPRFLIPSITVHEMAHQLGYAKENEANFVGFLVGKNSRDPLFRYSSYLDLLMYANSELRFFDSSAANKTLEMLSPSVRLDLMEWRKFNMAHQSFLEPGARWLYGNFLKMNEQPHGILTYDRVISLVISYYEKEDLIR